MSPRARNKCMRDKSRIQGKVKLEQDLWGGKYKLVSTEEFRAILPKILNLNILKTIPGGRRHINQLQTQKLIDVLLTVYGLNGAGVVSNSYTARLMGISPEMVRNKRNKVLAILRNPFIRYHITK